MNLIIGEKTSIVKGNFPAKLAVAIADFEGRKEWLKPMGNGLRFTTSEHNLRLVREAVKELEEVDNRIIEVEAVATPNANLFDFGQGVAKPSLVEQTYTLALQSTDYHDAAPYVTNYPFKVEPFKFQGHAFGKLLPLRAAAIFAEQGTGKTKIAIDILGARFLAGEIDCAIVFSWPKGVHHQWVDEALPEHMSDKVPYKAVAWNGKAWPEWVYEPMPGVLKILSVNIEVLVHAGPMSKLMPVFELHGKRANMVVDESQSIKNFQTKRGQQAYTLGSMVGWRIIMTGTPIAKDLCDEWAQFKFLDERIIGQKFVTAFRKQFCVFGGYDGQQITGYKNLETFNKWVSPHIFRITKKEGLDLPEKMYDRIVFDLSDEQKRHQKELKADFLTKLATGEIATVANAAVLIGRLQQLSCGYLVDEDKTLHILKQNPRMEALEALVDARLDDKIIIWARFNKDIELLLAKFGKAARSHYGPDSPTYRKESKELFLDRDSGVKFWIANPAAGGTGIDGLQNVCRTAVYYSNGFNAVERWQSEDRIHRQGTTETVWYFDLVARGSVDAKILHNLQQKKSLASLVLDDIRRMVEEL